MTSFFLKFLFAISENTRVVMNATHIETIVSLILKADCFIIPIALHSIE